jgi:hypothetical protein
VTHLQQQQGQQEQGQQEGQQQQGQRQQQRQTATSSRSRGTPGSTAYAQYMLQLSNLALSIACSGGFRGQQYSNVLWCFARCGYELPPLWMHRYLSQVSSSIAEVCCAACYRFGLCSGSSDAQHKN